MSVKNIEGKLADFVLYRHEKNGMKNVLALGWNQYVPALGRSLQEGSRMIVLEPDEALADTAKGELVAGEILPHKDLTRRTAKVVNRSFAWATETVCDHPGHPQHPFDVVMVSASRDITPEYLESLRKSGLLASECWVIHMMAEDLSTYVL